MKTMKNVLISFMIFLLIGFLLQTQPAVLAEPFSKAYTPKPGSAERKAILDALRAWVKQQHYVEVIFVVRHMKVKNGYVWVHTMPQSKDGKSMYEDVSALLKKEKDYWEVVEIPCGEEENPDCIGAPKYFEGLKNRFPDMPEGILPE